MSKAWERAAVIQGHLYRTASTPLSIQWGIRIGKCAEEAGEAFGKWVTHTGHNPLKDSAGVTLDDILHELADVVLTGMVAMISIAGDEHRANEILEERIEHKISALRTAWQEQKNAPRTG